jgi:hypothetical protein
MGPACSFNRPIGPFELSPPSISFCRRSRVRRLETAFSFPSDLAPIGLATGFFSNPFLLTYSHPKTASPRRHCGDFSYPVFFTG